MAYAVASLVEILEQDQHHLSLDSKNEIQNFLEKARSLRDILLQRRYCFMDDDLSGHLIDAAHMAEDVIEDHIGNQILLRPAGAVSQLDLTDLVQQFESIIELLLEETADDDPERRPSLPIDYHHSPSPSQVASLPIGPGTRNNGDVPVFEDDFQTLKARLIKGPSQLQIISLYGMWGMGKRTLARRLYNDPLVANHFGTRAWLSDPIEVNAKTSLLNLLDALGKLTSEMHRKTVDELKVYIRKALKNIRYFIVIHDVYGDNFVTYTNLFRDYGVGARVLFTAFATDDAELPSYGEPYKMPFLTDSESWLLFCQKIFGRREHCPDELEPIGKIIIGLCKGIPQAVSLIAGFLATSEKTPAAWELVATTLSSMLEGEPIEKIPVDLLCFFYYHLPHYLKPCLLYVSAFYESRDIKASKIIKLWIAEGFVKQSAGECLEDVAETYLNILIDKNLLSPTHVEPNGRVTTFQLPLFLKCGCWMIALGDKFLGSKYLHDQMGAADEEKIVRRVSSHGLFLPGNEMELPSLARSFLSISDESQCRSSIYFKLELLRVLEVFMLEFYQFPIEIMQQVLLRYLSFSCHSNLPNSFSILRNLQTLIIRRLPAFRAFSLPPDLWGLTLLRHVKCKETFVLSHPTNGNEVVHGNLQTLSNMQLLGVTNQFLGQIPKIRNMGIFCNIAMETVFDLACLDKLETLKCSTDWSLASRNFLAYLTLPQSLRKLNLSLCRIPAEFMKVVGSLPNLELLKLQKSDFFGVNTAQSAPEWVPAEREFPQLVSLEMLDLNLVHWKANANHFPKLKHLVIRNCYAMMEIPLDIGNIQTLELIQVNKTSPSALVSAMQIKKEQEGRGNKCLEVLTFKVVV